MLEVGLETQECEKKNLKFCLFGGFFGSGVAVFFFFPIY